MFITKAVIALFVLSVKKKKTLQGLLRYSIEHFNPKQREHYMNLKRTK